MISSWVRLLHSNQQFVQSVLEDSEGLFSKDQEASHNTACMHVMIPLGVPLLLLFMKEDCSQ